MHVSQYIVSILICIFKALCKFFRRKATCQARCDSFQVKNRWQFFFVWQDFKFLYVYLVRKCRNSLIMYYSVYLNELANSTNSSFFQFIGKIASNSTGTNFRIDFKYFFASMD